MIVFHILSYSLYYIKMYMSIKPKAFRNGRVEGEAEEVLRGLFRASTSMSLSGMVRRITVLSLVKTLTRLSSSISLLTQSVNCVLAAMLL